LKWGNGGLCWQVKDFLAALEMTIFEVGQRWFVLAGKRFLGCARNEDFWSRAT